MSATRSVGSTVFWAVTWALGAAIGVALGGWLTVVGGAGTPGVESLDLVEDVLLLPAIVGLVVFCAYLLGAALVSVIRRDGASGKRDDEHQDGEDSQ